VARCDFIGYATFMHVLVLYLSAMPSFCPALLSEYSLSVFLLAFLPAVSVPPLMLRPKKHHLDLEVCIFIASLHLWLLFLIVASIMVLKDHNTRGTRQGNIKHVSRIRTIAPSVL
jgi:hypothetical protein